MPDDEPNRATAFQMAHRIMFGEGMASAPTPMEALQCRIDQREAEQAAKAFPSDLLKVGGVIGDIVRLCVDTAISPQPELALGAALCLVGTLAGQKYSGPYDTRTNLYAIGLADSGGGKDNARKIIKRLLHEAGLSDFVGGDELASGGGVLTALKNHPCRLFLLDEMGKFIKSVTGNRVGAHREEIWTVFTKLYTSSSSVYNGKEHADQRTNPRHDLNQPCASIWGVTVPNALWSALGSGDMVDGSLARFMLFQVAEDYPDRNKRPAKVVITDTLIASLNAIVAGAEPDEPRGNLVGRLAPNPYEVPTAPDAEAAIDKIMDSQTQWLRARRGTNDTAIIARFAENVNKVALIRAIGDNPARPVITRENVVWAEQLVERSTETMLREAKRNIADNETEKSVKRLEDFIRKRRTVKRADISAGCQWAKARELAEMLTALIDAGKVAMQKGDSAGAGRKAEIYHWLGE